MTTQPLLLPAIYIENNDALRDLVSLLMQESLIALDTEANSLYAYRERVCLVQISTRSADYIVDPLADVDMSLLAPLMANPNIQKVFHAAEYDQICMKRDFGYSYSNLFDTMIAARICAYKSIGLANLIAEHIGIEMDKSHQRDDWARRPLSQSSLRYAQMDTHYLPLLRDILNAELEAMHRLEEAAEAFEDLCYVELPERDFDPEGFWRIGLPFDLNRREMSLLRELYLLREEIAQDRDVPPFKIFSNKTLVALARQEPRYRDELLEVEGITPLLVRRFYTQIMHALERGKRNKLPPQPMPPSPDPGVTERYAALHQWRKERAIERGVESDVIVSKDTLWMLAREAPTTLDALRGIRGLGPWRLEAYGEEILKILSLP